MARIGKYIWWCGGVGGEGDGPEHRGEYIGASLFHIDTWCSTCKRLAPFQNGCRWVDPDEFEKLEGEEESE